MGCPHCLLIHPCLTPLQPPTQLKALWAGSEFNQEVSREGSLGQLGDSCHVSAQYRPRPGFERGTPGALWEKNPVEFSSLPPERERADHQRLDPARLLTD